MERSRGRYYSRRDVRFMNSLNGELMLNIIEQIIIVYKINADQTKSSIYGESLNKVYYPGVEISCLVESDPQSTSYEGFGPDVKKGTIFRFHQKLCETKEIYPEIGDIVMWENTFFEISNIVENQFLGGQPEKNYSLLCNAHMTRKSKLNITPRAQ
tara:strand:- start:1685 stop:2152 length:468 start_codon:yes stop_codon:yes gene_type:complete